MGTITARGILSGRILVRYIECRKIYKLLTPEAYILSFW